MDNKYPLMVYKVPGIVEFQDCSGEHLVVNDEAEHKAANEDGWRDTVAEAKAAYEDSQKPKEPEPEQESKNKQEVISDKPKQANETAAQKKKREAAEAKAAADAARLALVEKALALKIDVQEDWTDAQIQEAIDKAGE